jgi:cell division protein FtsW
MPRASAAKRARRPAKQQPIEYNLLVTATLCLLAAGAVMVYSASSARDLLQDQGDGSAYLIKYVMYGAIGLAVMYALSRRPLTALDRLTGPVLALSFFLLVAVKLPGVGVEVNGARRWIGAGPLQFQPSELAKLAMVLYAAKLLAQRPKAVLAPKQLLPLLCVVGMTCLLVASQPDLGTALVIAFTSGALLVAAGMPLRYLAAVVGVAALLIAVFAILEPYRRARLTSFLDPWADPGNSGFQSVQGQIAIGSGGFLGVGLGQSVQKMFFLPEAHTDFILAILGEELGIAGVWGLLCLYGLIAYAGLRTARNAVGSYAKLLATGLTSLILCQATLNLFAVLGLAPLTGVPLPFISSGSSNLLVLLASMGLLLNVARGGQPALRAVPVPRDRSGSRHDAHRDRGRRDSGARGARAGGRRRAAG